ncbi:MAG: BlaI/MecI/CopY family transcriptional regulator [Spirochaetota bacterium]
MDESNHITEAEWQVMRAVWSAVPATSGNLVRDLSGSTGWEPTTVKTLLARLVKKGALHFEVSGRSYLYYPLLSEEACIRREMRLFAGKIYGGELHLATAHFDFRGIKDPDFIGLLAQALEEGFSRICSDLAHESGERLLVYIHGTQQRLHSALGVLDGPDWLRAGQVWGILHFAPLSCFSDLPADKVAVHVLTQLVVTLLNPAAPYWLQQAVAVWEGQWLEPGRIAKAVADRSAGFNLALMQEVSAIYRQFRAVGGYELAWTVADFIVSEFGLGSLADLVRNPADFGGVFGFPESEFWRRWEAYLGGRYG